MENIKLSIDIVNKFSSYTLAAYFAVLSTMDEQGVSRATYSEIASVLGVGQSIKDTITKLVKEGYLNKGKSGAKNVYSYSIPERSYITINRSILDKPLTVKQLSTLIKLKANTAIGTNLVGFSGKTLNKMINFNRDNLTELLKKGLVKKTEFGYDLMDDKIFIIN